MDITTLLLLAFGLGLLHALDADHVMAVTGLVATQSRREQCRRFCTRWAVGHGVALLMIGTAVIVLGAAIPEGLSSQAEALVGVVLIALAAWVGWDLAQRRVTFLKKHHAALPGHRHWYQRGSNAGDAHARHSHSALLIGLLHGTAGAAPFLLLLPLSATLSPAVAFSYLLIFCAGVLVSMLFFGDLLARLYGFLGRYGNSMLDALRSLVACSSLLLGLHLLGAY